MALTLSIVTPSYNQGMFLEQTIGSVLNQAYPHLEYVVIDGGSRDESVAILNRYSDRLTYWVSEPDGGMYDALNKGFSHTTGDIMAWINSDDMYTAWAFAVVGQIFEQLPQVEWLTTSLPLSWGENSTPTGVSVSRGYSQRGFYAGEHLPYARWYADKFIQQESTFWRRSLWEKAGAYLNTRLHYAGDFELWSRFFEHAIPVTVDIPLAMFRIHDDQKTSDLDKYIMEAENVLSHYVCPIRVPSLFIRLINYIYLKTGSTTNWLGARCDNVKYDLRSGNWVYKRCLEWRDFTS